MSLPAPTDAPVLARLLLVCAQEARGEDAVNSFLAEWNATVLERTWAVTAEGQRVERVEFTLKDFHFLRRAFADAFQWNVAENLSIGWKLAASTDRPRAVVFAGQDDHALPGLLEGARAGELPLQVPMVLCTHESSLLTAQQFGVGADVIPALEGAELQLLLQLAGQCDLLVLAGYDEALSDVFLRKVGVPILEASRSLLLEAGGVTLLQARARYVTPGLGPSPVIHSEELRLQEGDSRGLAQAGRELERAALHRALLAHLEDRLVVDGDRVILL